MREAAATDKPFRWTAHHNSPVIPPLFHQMNAPSNPIPNPDRKTMNMVTTQIIPATPITPSMSSLQALLSKLPSVTPPQGLLQQTMNNPPTLTRPTPPNFSVVPLPSNFPANSNIQTQHPHPRLEMESADNRANAEQEQGDEGPPRRARDSFLSEVID
eukprot:TRINITY_DN21096_c0_g1_i1.p1 TRINITY_DN21096_c0_g1~~TRINITY_DN21096_c0_g1_i1.p1  ORF type:complete len:158 (+),score=22.41 TRINITY_DN21096_c0_g1_i1:465-938(+)